MRLKTPRISGGGQYVLMPGEELDETWVGEMLPPLSGKKLLKVIDLSKNAIGFKGIQCIVNVLKTLPDIQALDLSFCGLKDDSAQLLAQYLFSNPSLQKLYLNDNLISDGGVDLLVIALMENTNLKQLHLSSNCIQSSGVFKLLDMLDVNTQLEVLNIAKNHGVGEDMLSLVNFKLKCAKRKLPRAPSDKIRPTVAQKTPRHMQTTIDEKDGDASKSVDENSSDVCAFLDAMGDDDDDDDSDETRAHLDMLDSNKSLVSVDTTTNVTDSAKQVPVVGEKRPHENMSFGDTTETQL